MVSAWYLHVEVHVLKPLDSSITVMYVIRQSGRFGDENQLVELNVEAQIITRSYSRLCLISGRPGLDTSVDKKVMRSKTAHTVETLEVRRNKGRIVEDGVIWAEISAGSSNLRVSTIVRAKLN